MEPIILCCIQEPLLSVATARALAPVVAHNAKRASLSGRPRTGRTLHWRANQQRLRNPASAPQYAAHYRHALMGKPGAGGVAAAVSLALAALAAAVLLVVPLGSQVESVEVSPGAPTGAQLEQEREVERVSLLEHEGASVLVPLLIPMALAGGCPDRC